MLHRIYYVVVGYKYLLESKCLAVTQFLLTHLFCILFKHSVSNETRKITLMYLVLYANMALLPFL